MQTAINTDNFVMTVLDTLMNKMDMWIDEQERLNQVKMALYMNLMNKTILTDPDADRQLPAEYVDDTLIIIERFLLYMGIEQRTESTIESYRREIRNFFRYVQKNYADITKMDVMAYLSHKQLVDNNGNVTLNTKIHILKSFYTWVMNEDTIEDGGCLSRKPKKNPMAKVNKIKEEKKVRTVLTDEQVEIIRCDCKCLRDRAIVEVLIATGMRISELTKLNLDDIDIVGKRCIIYGKGRKERHAFFSDRSLVHLKAYIKNRRRMTECENALFLNDRKSNKDGVALYRRMLNDSVRHMLNTIQSSDPRLEGVRVHPHAFRAYLATYMARHGASIKDIKNILGHANVNTTLECYIVEDMASIQSAHQMYVA